MRFARFTRLFADEDGETHFEDLEVLLKPRGPEPLAGRLFAADFLPVSSSFWLGAPGDWPGEAFHPSARRQIFCTVEGEYEVTASDGTVRCFPAGSILLFEDTSGSGHQLRIADERGALVFAVAIAEEIDASLVV